MIPNNYQDNIEQISTSFEDEFNQSDQSDYRVVEYGFVEREHCDPQNDEERFKQQLLKYYNKQVFPIIRQVYIANTYLLQNDLYIDLGLVLEDDIDPTQKCLIADMKQIKAIDWNTQAKRVRVQLQSKQQQISDYSLLIYQLQSLSDNKLASCCLPLKRYEGYGKLQRQVVDNLIQTNEQAMAHRQQYINNRRNQILESLDFKNKYIFILDKQLEYSQNESNLESVFYSEKMLDLLGVNHGLNLFVNLKNIYQYYFIQQIFFRVICIYTLYFLTKNFPLYQQGLSDEAMFNLFQNEDFIFLIEGLMILLYSNYNFIQIINGLDKQELASMILRSGVLSIFTRYQSMEYTLNFFLHLNQKSDNFFTQTEQDFDFFTVDHIHVQCKEYDQQFKLHNQMNVSSCFILVYELHIQPVTLNNIANQRLNQLKYFSKLTNKLTRKEALQYCLDGSYPEECKSFLKKYYHDILNKEVKNINSNFYDLSWLNNL